MAEKPSEDLFTVDTKGSESFKRAHKSCIPLKADQIIAARSKVPAVSTHKRSGDAENITEPNSKRHRGNGIKPREFERLKQLAHGRASTPKDVVQTGEVPDHDPWASPDPIANDEDDKHSYLDKAKPIKAPSTLKQPPVSLLTTTSSFPAVPKPKAGTSYNPSFNEWDQLLTSEGAQEVEAERKRLAEKAADGERLNRIATAQNERDDYQTEDESIWEGFESEYEGADWLKKRRPERKTQAERNKVKRRKEAERQAKHQAQLKKRERQASQIRGIAKQVEKEAKARTDFAVALVNKDDGSAKEQEVDDHALRRRRFGKHA